VNQNDGLFVQYLQCQDGSGSAEEQIKLVVDVLPTQRTLVQLAGATAARGVTARSECHTHFVVQTHLALELGRIHQLFRFARRVFAVQHESKSFGGEHVRTVRIEARMLHPNVVTALPFSQDSVTSVTFDHVRFACENKHKD
jgi:hypothetical protein